MSSYFSARCKDNVKYLSESERYGFARMRDAEITFFFTINILTETIKELTKDLEEVNKSMSAAPAPQPAPQASGTTDAAPASSASAPVEDARLKYRQNNGALLPEPVVFKIARKTKDVAPLKPIHQKDVEKLERYGGSIDDWLAWSRSFKMCLKGRDPRWEVFFANIELLRGKPDKQNNEEERSLALKPTLWIN